MNQQYRIEIRVFGKHIDGSEMTREECKRTANSIKEMIETCPAWLDEIIDNGGDYLEMTAPAKWLDNQPYIDGSYGVGLQFGVDIKVIPMTA